MDYQTYQVRVYPNGSKSWYLNGKWHREDGPAVEWSDGVKWWYLDGKRHREDGPAVEWSDGSKYWYLDGKRHREDGPAVEWSDGSKRWYLHGEELSEKEFLSRTNSNPDPCANKVVEIEGKRYRLIPA